MIILPAIDIQDGTCVRLVKGDFGNFSQSCRRLPENSCWICSSWGILDSHGGFGWSKSWRTQKCRFVFGCCKKYAVKSGTGRRYSQLGYSRSLLKGRYFPCHSRFDCVEESADCKRCSQGIRRTNRCWN